MRYVSHYPFIIIFVLLLLSTSFREILFFTFVMVLWDVIQEFECKIYWFMVNPISFNNSWHALLSGCICSYVINIGSINCCNFFSLNSIEYWSTKLWSSFGCVEFWSNMSILKSLIIIMGQEIGIRSKKI